MKVSISGSGNSRVHSDKSLDVKISGSGDVQYKGNATDVVKHIGGSGTVTKI